MNPGENKSIILSHKILAIKKKYDDFNAVRTVKSVLNKIYLVQFSVYQEKYQNADPPPGSSKYLDIEYWMIEALYFLYRLNLSHSRPLNILEIGTGCGYFPYLCQYFGHSVVAIDLDIVPMYNEITSFLSIDRRVYKIQAFEHIPSFSSRFDLITAFSICFNNHNKSNLWGVNEWSFFPSDLTQNHLSKPGSIFLKLNAELEGGYYNAKLLNFFIDANAQVDGRHIHFSTKNTFSTKFISLPHI